MSRIITRNLMCKLTEKEIQGFSRQLAENTQAVSCLEEEKKANAAAFASKISRHRSNISDLARKVTTGQEMRDIDCEWTYDWEGGIKYLHRLDNYEEIEREAIRDYERQDDLPIDEEDGKEDTGDGDDQEENEGAEECDIEGPEGGDVSEAKGTGGTDIF